MRPTLPILSAALVLAAATACQTNAPEETVAVEQHAPPPVTAALEPYECGNVTRLHTYEGIFLASQPGPADFDQAAQGGVRTVINIRKDAEQPDFDERGHVEGLGLTYVHLPWSGPDEMTDEIVEETMRLFDTAERPILLHCKSSNRVGAVWLPYRVLRGGLSVEEALAEAKTVGMKSPAYEAKALDYIARHAK